VKSFGDLEVNHFSQIANLKPELILIGTGSRQQFPRPELLKNLILAKIGFEIMDSQASLLAKGRQVLLALIVEPT